MLLRGKLFDGKLFGGKLFGAGTLIIPPAEVQTTTKNVVITRRDRRKHPKWNELYR